MSSRNCRTATIVTLMTTTTAAGVKATEGAVAKEGNVPAGEEEEEEEKVLMNMRKTATAGEEDMEGEVGGKTTVTAAVVRRTGWGRR